MMAHSSFMWSIPICEVCYEKVRDSADGPLEVHPESLVVDKTSVSSVFSP